VNPGRIAENLKSTEVKLDPEDMKRLREADKNKRLLSVRTFKQL
jgi:diketogulonate reductase-like aldo/keto reductase